MPETGVELSDLKASKRPISKVGGAKSGAPEDKINPDLAQLIHAWPTLPKQVKSKINKLIQTHISERK